MSNELIPAQYRKTAYAIFALIGVILGGTQVGFDAAEAAQPIWLTVALAVYAFVGGALGLTAAQHTPTVEQFGVWDGADQSAEVDDMSSDARH